MTVIWLGVIGIRPRVFINLSAWRRTHASNRVVNIYLLDMCGFRLAHGSCLSRLFVNLENLGGDDVPAEPACLFTSVSAHAASKVSVAGEDDQRRPELSPAFGLHRQ